MFVLRRQPGRAIAAFEGNGDAAPDRRTLSELAQRRTEATTPCLIGAQRHDGTPCFREAFAGERAYTIERSLHRAARTGLRFFGCCELHQYAGKRLREAVVNV